MGQSETSLSERLRQIAEAMGDPNTTLRERIDLADELDRIAQALLAHDAGHWVWGRADG